MSSIETCDDCGRDYPGPAYYTFDPEGCVSTRDWIQEGERIPPPGTEEEMIPHGDDCTGNLCPACAGPDLEPDEEDDPRRPCSSHRRSFCTAVHYTPEQAKAYAEALIADLKRNPGMKLD